MDLVKKGDYNFGKKTFFYNTQKTFCLLANKDLNMIDLPDAIDFALLEKSIRALQAGESIDLPEYDYENYQRKSKTQRIQDPDIILIPGMHILYQESIRKLMDLTLFLDVDSDVRLSRQGTLETLFYYQASHKI